MLMASKILGCGGYLPKHIVHNDYFSHYLDTNNEWIVSRTGISQRHFANDDQCTSQMAFEAAKDAISKAKILASDIDLIMVCTTTPDNSFPSTATKLQGYLHLNSIPSFDLQAVCSGFIYGLHVADSLITANKYKTILLVCAEKMSSLLDFDDRKTCVLFGDGAAAVVLQYSVDESGIIDSKICSDGSYCNLLYTDGGVSTTQSSGKIRMNGQLVFKHAVDRMSQSILSILQENELTFNDVHYFIPHQANTRLINAVINKLQLDPKKLISTIDQHANCSAASIPLSLNTIQSQLKIGNIILFVAFGAGFTWGSAIVRW